MTAEVGHNATGVYISQAGDLHLQSAKVYDSTETDITSNVNLASVTATATELNKLAGVTAGTNTASKALVVGASNDLNVLTVTTLTSTTANVTTAADRLLRLSPQPTDTYSGTMTLDVTYSAHFIAAANGTSATVTFTPSAAGTAGDILVIRTAATGGTVTATFASTFHSSGTQATTVGAFSTILFLSDGTRWCEIARTTALA